MSRRQLWSNWSARASLFGPGGGVDGRGCGGLTLRPCSGQEGGGVGANDGAGWVAGIGCVTSVVEAGVCEAGGEVGDGAGIGCAAG